MLLPDESRASVALAELPRLHISPTAPAVLAPAERTGVQWSRLPVRAAGLRSPVRTGPVVVVNAGSGSWLRAASFSYVNDLFFFKHLNSDRDLTGAVRLELLIDPAGRAPLARLPGFVTLSVGADAYTPYIRDTTIYREPMAINRDDRPFASFVYLGLGYRSRLGSRGFGSADLRIGAFGTNLVSGGQTLIHKYLFPNAVTPQGWETQIEAGGRLGASLRAEGEVRLDRPRTEDRSGRLPHPVPTLVGGGMIGHEGTRIDAGLRVYWGGEPGFGEWGLASRSSSRRLRLAAMATARLRYWAHDSMLEGYGVLRPGPGVGPGASGSRYALSRGRDGSTNQIRAYVGLLDVQVSARWGRVGVSAKQQISTATFDIPALATRRDPRGRPYDASPLQHVGTVTGVLYF